MKSLFQIVLATFLTIGFSACDMTSLQKGMIQFDKAFIPVFYYTYHGDMPSAKKAVFNLEFQWQKFNNQYAGMLPENEDWQETFRLVNDWLGDAYHSIDCNDRELALVMLEHVRFEFMDMRAKQHIEYYLDYLYHFQMAMDHLIEISSDQCLSLLEWEEFEQVIDDVNLRWRLLASKSFDADLYKFNHEKLARFAQHKKDVNLAMSHFNHLVEGADSEQILLAARAVQPEFFKMLSLFGTFEDSQTYFAQLDAIEE